MADKGEFEPGDIVGDTYEVLGYIGRGAMGHVYHVRHRALQAQYALKTLSREAFSDITWRRFQNEAQAISIMNHPNVVGIYNLGLHTDNIPYYVMDLLSGVDLGQKIRADGPLSTRQAINLFLEVCAGLSYAHKKGIVHRDIKPGNIFLLDKPGSTGETVKVVDFGIAKLSQAKDPENQSLTAVGDVLGTPYYMSPEQCVGQRVDARSDVYSLGCTIFEALTGTPPFRGRNPTDTMLMHSSAAPPTLKKASGGREFPEYLEQIIEVTLAKSPQDRYQNVDQLARDLAAVVDEGMLDPPAARYLANNYLPDAPTLRVTVGDPPSPPKNNRLYIVVPAVALTLLLGAGGLFLLFNKKSGSMNLDDALQKYQAKLEDNLSKDDSLHRYASSPKTGFAKDPQVDEIPKNQNVSQSLMRPDSFSTIVTSGSSRIRKFEFPMDVVIGVLKTRDPDSKERAEGMITYPYSKKITFIPFEVVGKYPDCLKRFQPGDIWCLDFDPAALNDDVLKACLNMPTVHKLSFAKCKNLPPSTKFALRAFQHLTDFDATESGFDGATLAQAGCWNKITDLNLSNVRNLEPMLEVLKNSNDLRKLTIVRCKLNAKEFQSLSQLTQVTKLDLFSTPVSEQDLTTLTALKNLSAIHLGRTGLNAKSLTQLKKFRWLTYLDLSGTRLSDKDLAYVLGLGHFEELKLPDTGLSVSAIKLLKDYLPLKNLQIKSRDMSDDLWDQFKDGLPGVYVH